MGAAELSKIGRKLYGKHWKGKFAAALKVDPATLRRWLAADEVPPSRAVTIEMMARQAGASS